MKLRRVAWAAFPIAAVALYSACSSSDEATNPGTTTSPDGSAPTDTGTTPDASSPVDSSTDVDADAAPAALKQDCKSLGETKSGTYDFDPDGAGPLGLIQLYCDNTWDGGGWTLVEAFSEINSGPSGLPDASGSVVGPKPGQAAMLPRDVMSALALRATQVHIRYSFAADGGAPDSGTAKWITSKTTSVAIIENLRRLALLNRDLDAGTIQDLFEGPSATSGTLSFHDNDPQCNATLLHDAGYPALYHACGNFTGLHIVDDVARFNFSAPKNEPIEIYIR